MKKSRRKSAERQGIQERVKPKKTRSTNDGRAYDPNNREQQTSIAGAVNSGATPPGGYRDS